MKTLKIAVVVAVLFTNSLAFACNWGEPCFTDELTRRNQEEMQNRLREQQEFQRQQEEIRQQNLIQQQLQEQRNNNDMLQDQIRRMQRPQW